jgi:hypothetical protein
MATHIAKPAEFIMRVSETLRPEATTSAVLQTFGTIAFRNLKKTIATP